MEEIKLESIYIDEFHVTRTHGMNAFYNLTDAYQIQKQWKINKQISDQETSEEIYLNAGSTGSRMMMAEYQLLEKLSATVILYQASMEAILSIASSKNQKVEKAVKRTSGFKNKWIEALKAVEAETKEFNIYFSEFYKDLRIPLTHLHPKTDERLVKIRSISFKKVYNGVRFGWWAYIRLLHGIGLANDKYNEHWEFICKGKLDPNLYPNDNPNNL